MLAKRPDTRLASNFSVFLINSVEAPITVIRLKWNQNRTFYDFESSNFQNIYAPNRPGGEGRMGGGLTVHYSHV